MSTDGEPIPHWPGKMISVGDHAVYVRSVAGGATGAGITEREYPRTDITGREYRRTDITGREYRRAGVPEPALCVHGLEGSSRNWTDLMDELRPRLACDALDLPGFGSSPPRPDGRYSVAALSDTVIALIERRGRGPVHLIGNSLGGVVCVKVAASRPDLVRSLTLVSPAMPDLRPRLDLLRFPLMAVTGVGGALVRQVRATLPPERRVAEVVATCFGDPALFPPQRFAHEVDELTRRDSLEYAAAVLIGSVRALVAETLRVGRGTAWRDAARVAAPALVIYGGRDRLVDKRAAGRAAHAFSNARIVVLPHTGHVAQMEHPAQVAAEIGVLLDSAASPKGAGRSRSAREFPLTPAG